MGPQEYRISILYTQICKHTTTHTPATGVGDRHNSGSPPSTGVPSWPREHQASPVRVSTVISWKEPQHFPHE